MLKRRNLLIATASALAAASVSGGVFGQTAAGTGRIEARLKQLGLTLPAQGPAPVANYTPVIVDGGLAHIAGQIPFVEGKLAYVGRVGGELTLEQGQAAARQVGINMIALLKRALDGDLDRVRRLLRVNGFVSSANEFTQQPVVMNGFSNLMTEVFGSAGVHTRTAVGVNVLPLNAPVEINAVFSVG